MAERRRRQDWARPPGSQVAPRMRHHGCEQEVPPDTSLKVIATEPKGAAQDGNSNSSASPQPKSNGLARPKQNRIATSRPQGRYAPPPAVACGQP